MHLKIQPLKARCKYLGICLLLSYSPLSLAQTEQQTINQLAELIKNGQYVQAYALADKYVIDYGGEPNFDYLTGLAAMQVGEFQQAVFAFERAIFGKPQWHQARFNLAKGYFRIDNYAAAEKELNRLLIEAKDEKLLSSVRTFLSRAKAALVEQQRVIRQVFGLSVGHDTNINSGANINEFSTPSFNQPIQLDKDGQETPDFMANLSYQLHYRSPISQRRLLIGDVGVFHTNYSESEHDTFESTAAVFSGKLQDTWGDNIYQIGVYYRPLMINGASYRNQFGFDGNLQVPINSAFDLNFAAGYGKSNYSQIETLDSKEAFINVTANYKINNWRHSVSGNFTDISSARDDGKHNENNFFILGYRANYTINLSHQINFSMQWQKFDYDTVHPFFLEVRQEELARASIGWLYLIDNATMLQFNYKHNNKHSNLAIYEYSRDEVSLGVLMQF